MEPSDYCREIEAYLCRKNEGHLIRIVGPAFEQVCGWATLGVPLKVAFRGIDQYCERYYAKGSRRRPVRIEFCEADILDSFDAWRRAIGVQRGDAHVASESPSRKPSLVAHIERALVRLTSLRALTDRSVSFGEEIERLIEQLDLLAGDARSARGEARSAMIDTLQQLDDQLGQAAAAEADSTLTARLIQERDAELAPFMARMPASELERAKAAAFDRLLRESLGIPRLTYD